MQCGEKCAIIPSMDDDRRLAAAATNQDYTLLLCILQYNNLVELSALVPSPAPRRCHLSGDGDGDNSSLFKLFA